MAILMVVEGSPPTQQVQLADLSSIMPDAVIAVDGEHRVVFFNPGAENIFGYRASDIIGQPLNVLLPDRYAGLHSRHLRTFERSADTSRAMATRRPVFGRARDGREFPAEAAIAKHEQNGRHYFVVILRDISERQRIEHELRTKAEQVAVANERNRLARDLHDAVTQTLFSISVIADVMPRIWERNREDGLRRLDQLRQLSRGALAEMRTLLMELRPSALADASLGELLHQLVEGARSRSRMDIQLSVAGDHPLLPEVKVGLYRIAQEALNNVVKHSGAKHASVLLRFSVDGPAGGKSSRAVVHLNVHDDGVGFDLSKRAAKSLGLDIMTERADALGAELSIRSVPGDGTDVSVVWRSTSRRSDST